MADAMECPPQSPNNDRCHQVFMTVAAVEGKMYSNQTGRFPITSNRGKILVAIFYAVNGNYIKSYPLKSRDRSQLLQAYEGVYAYLRMRGYRPKIHKLDNQTSNDFEAFTAKQQALVQYSPVYNHRTNIAKRSIRTWKCHFGSMLAGAPPTFPLANLCRMMEQFNATLNMLIPCTINPLLLAFEAMEGH